MVTESYYKEEKVLFLKTFIEGGVFLCKIRFKTKKQGYREHSLVTRNILLYIIIMLKHFDTIKLKNIK